MRRFEVLFPDELAVGAQFEVHHLPDITDAELSVIAAIVDELREGRRLKEFTITLQEELPSSVGH